ncbi:hypothetical protein N826_08900 [Skermanella aerolata KACC 11604]|nr:hypothetical protein N826_08900 [Skermanella aerolata KACC 11604]
MLSLDRMAATRALRSRDFLKIRSVRHKEAPDRKFVAGSCL